MKTKISQTPHATLIRLGGRLSIEDQDKVRRALLSLVDRKKTDEVPKKLIFDFENLQFVGSTGISSFIQTLREVNHLASERPSFCRVGSEFKKLIRAFGQGDEEFDFVDSSEGISRIEN